MPLRLALTASKRNLLHQQQQQHSKRKKRRWHWCEIVKFQIWIRSCARLVRAGKEKWEHNEQFTRAKELQMTRWERRATKRKMKITLIKYQSVVVVSLMSLESMVSAACRWLRKMFPYTVFISFPVILGNRYYDIIIPPKCLPSAPFFSCRHLTCCSLFDDNDTTSRQNDADGIYNFFSFCTISPSHLIFSIQPFSIVVSQ